jgi:citrate synthase
LINIINDRFEAAVTKFLTADEAIGLLKIRRQTLYAYVSRGLIRSNGQENDPHRRLYRADDIDALLGRKRRGRTPTRAAQTALDWGLPVLDSALTLVEDGRLHYRGQDAVTLAERGATLEDVARLLWSAADTDPFAAMQPAVGPLWHKTMPRCAGQSAVSRCLTLLPLAASVDTPIWPSDVGRKKVAAAIIVRSVAAALVGCEPESAPVHETLAAAWKLDANGADVVRAALVLCADHELNASTFTVRCVASTGASLGAAVVAGLAALSGPLHGGSWVWIAALFRDAEHKGVDGAIADWLRRGEQRLPGFGHPLYPDGDPRTTAILARLKHRPTLAEAVAAAGGPPPNLDYALLAMQRELGLPEDAPFIIFAAGRTVGWLAHALEQQATGGLLRPRARYTGPAPSA